MKLKKIICYILLTIWLPIMCLPLCGFTANGEMKIKHNGAGNATFFVTSELEEDAFQDKMKKVIAGLNSGSPNHRERLPIIKLNSIEQENNLYKVNLSFRRIDKVKPRGEIYVYSAKELKREGSPEYNRLLWRQDFGDIGATFANVYYDGVNGTVEIKVPEDNGPEFVMKPKTAFGEELLFNDFAKKVSEKNQIIDFQLVDTLGIQKIQISLPGRITYCSDNIKVINEGTFEITPITAPAYVMINGKWRKVMLDANGQPILDENTGKPIPLPEDIQTFVGYVAYQKSISPLEITIIVISAVALVGLVVFALVYFYQRGKKVQAKENLKKELENGRESSYQE